MRVCPKKCIAIHKVIGKVWFKRLNNNGQSHAVIHVGQEEEHRCPSSWVTGE